MALVTPAVMTLGAATPRRLRTQAKLAVALAAGVLAVPAAVATARADEPTTVDKPRLDEGSGKHQIDRTWLYVDDARVAPAWTAIGTTSVSYTRVGSNPDRVSAPYKPFAFNTAQPGALVSAGGEVGLLPRVSVMALGQMAAGGESGNPNAGAVAGVRVQLSPSSWQSVRLLVSGGYLREAWTADQPGGDNGVWAEGAIAGELHRLRLGLTAHGEHVFAEGRDGVDVMFKAGASYRIAGGFRTGIEWVGQDLEGSLQSDAEGGARQFLGPTASMQLLDDRLTMVAGPSLGLSERSPQLLGRFALSYGF
jgi:hypothetical protein